MKEIKKNIKENSFHRAYLIFGEERFLVNAYSKRLTEAVLKDGMPDVFDGKAPLEEIINAADSLPFLTEKRVVFVKDSGLFAAGRKADSEKMAEYLKNIPESTIIIFSETDVDKRTKLFKAMGGAGYAAEMARLDERELSMWVASVFKQNKKGISAGAIPYLIRYTGGGMENIFGEIQKLCDYAGDAEVTAEDIDAVCIKSRETKIFDLVDAIGNKNSGKALEIYANLIAAKESPLMVLAMIARQFRNILQCADLSKTMSNNEIAAKTGLRSFIVRECVNQGRNFTEETLIQALTDCLEADISVKTGKMGDELAVEVLIIKYSTK